MNNQHICVLGAGIVGLTTAWVLSKAGHQVTVVDRQGPGEGTSLANGAQLSYAHVQPLANASVWAQLPRLLTEADSPLRWELQADPSQWVWLARFLAACRVGRADRTTQALLTLAAESRAGYEQLLSETALACDFNDHGKLVLYPDAASLRAAERQRVVQRALGAPEQQLLGRDEVLAVEPALAQANARFAGALYTPSECAADPHLLCTGLAALLQARGVRLLLDRSVQGWHMSGKQVAAVRTTGGDVAADTFVVALGMGSRALLKPLGVRLPLYPLKGYSLTVPLTGPEEAAPRLSVTDAARRVVFARLGNRLRVAGVVELVGEQLALDPRRMQQLKQCGASWWPGVADWAQAHTASPWAGLRPATPTGLPLLGRWPGAPTNLLLNTGHGPLGQTLAFGSAQRLARLLG